jgi:hypothetical protein
MKIRPTNRYSIELHSSLFGLVFLLGELVLEPLLLSSCRLPDLLKLLLKVSNPLFIRCRVLQ